MHNKIKLICKWYKSLSPIGLSVDTRSLRKGEVFAAFDGSSVDGHDFIEQAIEKGAVGVIGTKDIPNTSVPYLRVVDMVDAIRYISEDHRNSMKSTIIGITGSVGKTTTKELVANMLRISTKTYASPGNYNSHIGMPISITKASKDSDYVVLEMGIDAPGEMSYLSNLAMPDIAVITKIAPAHLEFFGSLREIAIAKAEIFEGLKKNGVAVLNRDDEYYDLMRAHASKFTDNIITFGCNDVSDVQLKKIDNGIAFVRCFNRDLSYKCKYKHLAINSLIPLGILHRLGLDIDLSIIEEMQMCDGRCKTKEINLLGLGRIKIIDSAYNANPSSMRADFDALCLESKSRRKVGILGDMLELGDQARFYHEKCAEYCNRLDVLITVGRYMQFLHKKLVGVVNYTVHYNTADEVVAEISSHLRDGDVLLVKASNAMKLNKITDFLLNS